MRTCDGDITNRLRHGTLRLNYRRHKVRLTALKMKWAAMGARRVPVRT